MKSELYISTNRAFKNSTDVNSIIGFGNMNSDIGYFDYTLGDFEKIFNLEDFNVHYFADDTNRSHPVYAKRLDLDNPIDLNESVLSALMVQHKSDLHFYGPGYNIGDEVGIGRGLTDDEQQYYNILNNTDAVTLYGKENYYSLLGYWYNRNSYVYNIYTYQPSGNLSDVIDTYKDKYFKNGVIEGIKSYKDDSVYAQSNNLDVSIIPSGRNDENSNYSYMYFYNKHMNKELMRNNMDFVANVRVPGTNFVSYKTAPSPFFQLYNETLNIWSLNMALPICMYREELSDNNLYLSGLNPRDITYSTPYFFLKDKSGDYWYMKIFGIPNYNTYTTNSVVTPQIKYFNINYNSCPTIVMMRVKDAVTGATGQSDYRKIGEINTYPSFYNFGDDFDCNALLDEVFNPKPGPSYDDGGPDIVGPGDDPYDGVLDNSDEVVGGQPNMEDIIETDDGGYNNGGSLIRAWSSYYGSYVLDQSSLSKYVNTLTWLNEQWDKPLMWPIYSIMSDRLKNNTINLIHLPYTISSANYTPGKFVIGNTPIMASTTDSGLIGDWKWGRDDGIATANKLTQEITTDTVNLGVLSHYYDNFLDFAPYSSASLYIPYIGTVDIPINLIQSTSSEQKNIQLLFRINNATGDMVVLLQVNGSTLKQWTGNCARDVQISVDATGGVLRSMTKEIVGGVVGMASGFTSIPTASNSSFTSRTAYEAAKEQYNMMSPAMQKANPQIGKDIKEYEASHSASGDVTMTTLAENSMPNSTPVPNHSIGNMPVSGEVGFMGPQEVRLIVERPIIWRPQDYGDLIGYPTKKIAKLSSVQGFATVSNVHLRCSATLAEKSEIEKLLSAGVIF